MEAKEIFRDSTYLVEILTWDPDDDTGDNCPDREIRVWRHVDGVAKLIIGRTPDNHMALERALLALAEVTP